MNLKPNIVKIALSVAIGFSTVAALATGYNATQSKEVVIAKPITVKRIDLRHGEALLTDEDQNLVFVYFDSTMSNGELTINNVTDIAVTDKDGNELNFYADRDTVIDIVSTLESGQSLYEASGARYE